MFHLSPVHISFIADTDTPVSTVLKLKKYFQLPFLFESVESGNRMGRFSFIGLHPIFSFSISTDKKPSIKPFQPWFSYRLENTDPLLALKEIYSNFRSETVEGLPSFTSGLVGYFAYESIGLTEEKLLFEKPEGYPAHLVNLFCFDTLIVFDNVTRRITIIGNRWKSEHFSLPEHKTNDHVIYSELKNIKDLILDLRCNFPLRDIPSSPSFLQTESQFERGVNQTKDFISAGDIFQLVLSQRLTSTYHGDSFDLYRALRVINPSPYLFYMDMGDDFSIIGSSPEVMVRIKDREVEVRPIAGTRRRGKNIAEDAAIEQELRQDEKELAEHLMLIDLGRNDVGKVSIPGSVTVFDQMVIERYSHVMHIVSGVKGKLQPQLSPIDAFFSCFPAGTLTGAPKIRAMEIIEDIEPVRRGIYGGAIGYLDFNGGMDTCIAIRTMVRYQSQLFLQSGAGVVADSVAEREYQETMEKLNANLTGLSIVNELLP